MTHSAPPNQGVPTPPREYRFKVRPTIGDLAHIKMQRHVWGPFWLTVDEMIPLGDWPFDELIERGKDRMWQGEADRLDRRAHWSGKAAPEMVEVVA